MTALAATAALALLTAAPPGEAVRRAIAPAAPGKVAVALDRDVYERARSDLGDLRVVDERGAHVPYLLEQMRDPSREAAPRPRLPGSRREAVLTPDVRRTEDRRTRETVLSFDLGARAHPVAAVVLEVATPRFFREVIVEAARDDPRGREAPHWARIASGVVYRTEEGGRAHERLRVEAFARERALRVRILDRDDAPLELRSLAVRVPVESVVFEARPGRTYALEYGRPMLGAPAYDLARTVDAAAWSRDAAAAALGAPERVPVGRRLPWADRHPAVLTAGLLAAVAALGALTWRALRAAA